MFLMAPVSVKAVWLTLSLALLVQHTLSNNHTRIVCLPHENCDIYCHEHDACHNGYIQCAPGFACDVTCSTPLSCQHLTINATYASLFTLHDCGQHACDNMTVYFPPNTNGVPKGILNVDRDLNSYSNHLQFYAVNGWNDIYVANTANFSHGNNGVMYCSPFYDEQCAFAVDAWSCANGDDICNTYVANNDGITDFDSNAGHGMPPTNTDSSATPTDIKIGGGEDDEVISFVTMIADLDQLWYIVAAIIVFLCCFLCLLMYLIRRAYAVHYETAKQLKMAVDELKDFKAMQDLMVQSRTDESFTQPAPATITRASAPSVAKQEPHEQHAHEQHEYKRSNLEDEQHIIEMDRDGNGDAGGDIPRDMVAAAAVAAAVPSSKHALLNRPHAQHPQQQRPYLVSNGPESYTMPSMLPSAHLPSVPLDADSEDSKAYDKYRGGGSGGNQREKMLITPMVMNPDKNEDAEKKKMKKASRKRSNKTRSSKNKSKHKTKTKTKTKKHKSRSKDGGHKFKKLAMDHADAEEDDEEEDGADDDMNDDAQSSTDSEVAATDPDEDEKEENAVIAHVDDDDDEDAAEETNMVVKEVDAQSVDDTEAEKLTKQSYPLKPNKHGIEKWDPRTPVNSVGSPSMTAAPKRRDRFDMKQPTVSRSKNSNNSSNDRSRHHQKSRNFMEMKTAMMLGPKSKSKNGGGVLSSRSRHMSSQKTMASACELSPSMMSVRTTNTVNTMGTFVVNRSVNEQNEDEFIEHQHAPSVLFQHGSSNLGGGGGNGTGTESQRSSFHEHALFEDSTSYAYGGGGGAGGGGPHKKTSDLYAGAPVSRTTAQTSVNSRSQSHRNSDSRQSQSQSQSQSSEEESDSHSQSTDIMDILTAKKQPETHAVATGNANLDVPAASVGGNGGGGHKDRTAAIPNMSSTHASPMNPKTPQNQKMVVDIFDGLTGMMMPPPKNEVNRNSASQSYLYVQRASNAGSEVSRSTNPFADTVVGSAVSASSSTSTSSSSVSTSSSVSQRSSADSNDDEDEDEEEEQEEEEVVSDGAAQEILDKLMTSAKKDSKSVASKRNSNQCDEEDDEDDEDEDDAFEVDGAYEDDEDEHGQIAASDDGRTVVLHEQDEDDDEVNAAAVDVGVELDEHDHTFDAESF